MQYYNRVKKISKIFNKKSVIAFLAPIFTLYLSEFLIHNPFETMKLPAHLLNIVFYEILMIFLVFIFGRVRCALMVETTFFMVIGIANYFILKFRPSPIVPWDIFSIKTAAGVADNFKYILDPLAIILIIALIVLLVMEFFFTDNKRIFKWKIQLGGIFVISLVLYLFVHMLHQDTTVSRFKLNNKLFASTEMTMKNGTAVAFLMQLEYLVVEKPEGYEAEAVKEMLESYESDNTDNVGIDGQLPNIIVIMNEAFSDLNVLGEMETNQEYISFVRSLMENGENTKSGYLHVSVLGGNTANTEFEFLTGNSMQFLPQGSVPYLQYVKKEVPSIASYLKQYGYSTVGIHPYNSYGWERDRVYPLLGLDTNYFIEDFEGAELVRKYVSDKADYDKIIELYEEKESDQPLFIFNVTMQNHSGYAGSHENFTPYISVKGAEESKVLNNYLSLLHLSDQALEYLISYFEKVEEPTIIVFFGDHQPTDSVVRPIWELNGISDDSLTEEETARRYQVPYIIWSNYEMESEHGKDTSANFLASKVLEAAGILIMYIWMKFQRVIRLFPHWVWKIVRVSCWKKVL